MGRTLASSDLWHTLTIPKNEQTRNASFQSDRIYLQTSKSNDVPYYSGSSETKDHYSIATFNVSTGNMIWKYDVGQLIMVQDPITPLVFAP